jgi:uncharacterized protein (TIGR02145 family)
VDGYDKEQWQEVASEMKAVRPNVPSSPFLETGPIFYDVDLDDDPVTPVYLYEREIYTFEAKADATDKTCLVIGGYYNGSVSYYRVDFVDENEEHLSLLRNHNYHVKIKEVLAAGYASVAGALANPPSNIVVTITENDGTFGLIAFDEQNYLGASAGEITIRRRADAGHQFTVSTDVAAGWEVVGTSATSEFHEGFALSSWLTVTSSGLTEGKGDVTFDVTENDTDAKRVGYIHLVAGRLHLAVKVVQRFVEIWIEGPSLLTFEPASGVFSGQTFQVKWLPAGARVSAASIPSSGYPAFAYDDDLANDVPGDDFSDASGMRDVTFCPAVLTAAEIAVNPFAVRASIARFVAFYNDDFASADIELRQINYHIVPDVDAISNSGNIHSFPVRSNTEWKVKSGTLSDPDAILDPTNESTLLDQSGAYNTAPGDAFNLKLVDDAALSKNGGVTLTLTDPTGRAADLLVIIYRLDCGKNGVPVRQQIGNGDYLTHAYAGKCWMVQNSREGTEYSGTAFGWDANDNEMGNPNGMYGDFRAFVGESSGYYYTWQQANKDGNACPSGWHLPAEAEISPLKTLADNDASGIGKWWLPSGAPGVDTFSGCYNIMRDEWYYWGLSNQMWAKANHYYWWGYLGYGTPSLYLPTRQAELNNHWYGVRCAQD